MFDFPVVDTHLHLWDTTQWRYPWLDDVPPINRPFFLDEYRAACGAYEIGHMAFVQCEVDPAQYRQEVAWVSQLAQADPRIGAIVSWAPLSNGDAARADLDELAQNPLLRGIREIIQFQADPAWCLRPEMIRGVQMLADYDFHYELCIKEAEQSANAIELVRRCPQVRFILDHIGKPMIAQRELEPWKTHIRQLAAMEHVVCKVSGLVVEADRERWTLDDLRPYLDHVLECFGIERLMWGGDWPVVLLGAPLERWLQTAETWSQQFSPHERRRLFRENALAWYRIR